MAPFKMKVLILILFNYLAFCTLYCRGELVNELVNRKIVSLPSPFLILEPLFPLRLYQNMKQY